MEATKGTITMENEEMKVEQTLFTYSEEEQQEHKINKMNADLILKPQFITLDYAMLHSGYSRVETALYWFIKYFLTNNERFYCTNEQLAEMLCTSEKTISLAIKKLGEDWLISLSYKIRTNWGKTRFIRLDADFTKSNLPTLQNVISDFTKSNEIKNKLIENKKESKKKEKNQTSVSELVEAYREDERINNAFREEDVLEWLEYKKNRKELYATTKWFIQQLVVVKRMVAMDKPQLDIQKRFSFAVNEAISEWRKWIHRDEKTERRYLASKKDLFPTPNQ